jgi:hypothetical protein
MANVQFTPDSDRVERDLLLSLKQLIFRKYILRLLARKSRQNAFAARQKSSGLLSVLVRGQIPASPGALLARSPRSLQGLPFDRATTFAAWRQK